MTHLSERALSPGQDLSAWARTPATECYSLVSNG